MISSSAACTSALSTSTFAASAAWTISSSLTISSRIWLVSLESRRSRSFASAICIASPRTGTMRASSSLCMMIASLMTATTLSTMAFLPLFGDLCSAGLSFADATEPVNRRAIRILRTGV